MAAIYWLMGYPQAKLVDWIQRKFGGDGMTRQHATAAKRRRSRRSLVYRRRAQAIRRLRRARRHLAAGQQGRGGVPDRAVRLRQVDAAALHERARDHRRRRDPCSTACRCRRPSRRCAQGAPAHGHGVPELRAVSAQDGARQRGDRADHGARHDAAEAARGARRGAARQGRAGRQGRQLSRPTCPAASSSASPSPARWRWSRR